MNKHNTIELVHEFEAGVGVEIVPVEDNDLNALQRMLNHSSGDDPYKKSAAYFAMTGRDGLWLVRNAKATLLICQHPNLSDTILVFPPIGEEDTALIDQAVGAIERTGARATFARIEESERPDQNFTPMIGAKHLLEKELDWAYPVHTLSTEEIVQHKGKKFQQLRTHLNKIDQNRIVVTELDPKRDRNAIFKVLEDWMGTEEDKLSPYGRLLDLFETVPLAGRVIFQDNQPVGFSIWEETSPERGLANAYANIGLHEISGMARFVIWDMCEELLSRGFKHVCVGGSETEGLDQFKRQLRPVKSVQLSSFALFPKPLIDLSRGQDCETSALSIPKNHWQLTKTRYQQGVLSGSYNQSWHEALSIEPLESTFENLNPLMSRVSEKWGWKDQERYNETALRAKLEQSGTTLYRLRDERETEPVIGYALVSRVQQPLKGRFWSAANDVRVLEIDNLGLFPGNEGGGRGKAFFEMIFASHFTENDIVYWSQHETHSPTLTRFYRDKMQMEHLATDHVRDFRKPAARVA